MTFISLEEARCFRILQRSPLEDVLLQLTNNSLYPAYFIHCKVIGLDDTRFDKQIASILDQHNWTYDELLESLKTLKSIQRREV